jgi:hypothetical protein
MVSFAKVVAVLLLLIGILAFMVGFLSNFSPGYEERKQLLYAAQMFSGLILVALALGLYMLAYIAKEPAERHRQEVEAAQATQRTEEAAAYAAEHQVGARLGPRK